MPPPYRARWRRRASSRASITAGGSKPILPPQETGLRPPIRSSSTTNVLLCDTMSYRIGIRELRQQASAVLRRVRAGEIVEVTDHGHPVARIVPLARTNLDQLVVDGRATAVDGDLLDLLDELDLPVDGTGTRLPSQALAEMRALDRERS